MKPVSCGIAIRSWLSSISRSSVVPEPWEPTMKIGPRAAAGFRGGLATGGECRVLRRGSGAHVARPSAVASVHDRGGRAQAQVARIRARDDAHAAHRAD